MPSRRQCLNESGFTMLHATVAIGIIFIVGYQMSRMIVSQIRMSAYVQYKAEINDLHIQVSNRMSCKTIKVTDPDCVSGGYIDIGDKSVPSNTMIAKFSDLKSASRMGRYFVRASCDLKNKALKIEALRTLDALTAAPHPLHPDQQLDWVDMYYGTGISPCSEIFGQPGKNMCATGEVVIGFNQGDNTPICGPPMGGMCQPGEKVIGWDPNTGPICQSSDNCAAEACGTSPMTGATNCAMAKDPTPPAPPVPDSYYTSYRASIVEITKSCSGVSGNTLKLACGQILSGSSIANCGQYYYPPSENSKPNPRAGLRSVLSTLGGSKELCLREIFITPKYAYGSGIDKSRFFPETPQPVPTAYPFHIKLAMGEVFSLCTAVQPKCIQSMCSQAAAKCDKGWEIADPKGPPSNTLTLGEVLTACHNVL